MDPAYEPAELAKVLVFRGLPSSEHDPKGYARNQSQKSHWENDPRVTVEHRPLTYRYQYTAEGRRATSADGRWIVTGPAEEKGVDVMCALAFVREAYDPQVDIVVLASHDTDLIPALDEVLLMGSAKVETMTWYDTTNRYRTKQLRSKLRSTWNTRLVREDFDACLDLKDYTSAS